MVKDKSAGHIGEMVGFVGRLTLMHVVSYVGAGVLFSVVLGAYAAAYSSPAVSAYVRPTNDPLLAYAPLVQLVRGPIVALALWPFRSAVITRPWGWAVLFGVLLALQEIAAPGGVMESLIYTKVPVWFQLLNVPEVVLQLFAFSLAVSVWERRIVRQRTSRLSVGTQQ